MFITIALVVIALVALVLLYATTRPGTLHVERSASMATPAEDVFPLINDFHNWGAWSPYEKRDPAMKKAFSGAFSGKDPTKVDRSAAYACRYLAKNVVAAGLADRCTIQISYAIGIARPLSVYVDLQNTGKDVDETRIQRTLQELMNLTPRGIREHLHLNRPIYVPTSAYGHFGREPDGEKGTFTWEKTDLAPALRAAFGR